MRALKKKWAERNELEMWLASLLALALLVLAWFVWAWKQQLKPWATEYGTVADWVGAVGTIAAIFFAAYSFWKSAAMARHVEAQRVVTTWHTQENPEADVQEGEDEWALVATIYNFGSTAVRDVSLLLDIPAEHRQWSKTWAELQMDIPVIAPGKAETVSFGIQERSISLLHRIHMTGLNKDTEVKFSDSSGYKWLTRDAVTKRARGV